jgi:putative transposase
MFGRGLEAANSHRSTPSWGIASLSTPSDTSTTADLVQRRFGPSVVGRRSDLRVDVVGFAYVAFIVDAYVRRILGRRVATTMATSMVLDAIEQSIWTRQQRR